MARKHNPVRLLLDTSAVVHLLHGHTLQKAGVVHPSSFLGYTMAVTFRTTRMVEFGDTDMAGIIHFTNFFRYMEAAEHAFLRSRGLSVAMEWEGQSIGFPRVSASCDFQKPVRFEDVVEITLEVAHVGRKAVRYAIEFHHGAEVIARGQLTAVCCRMHREPHGLESIEIPAGLRARLLDEGGSL